jgi:hypothetical protein
MTKTTLSKHLIATIEELRAGFNDYASHQSQLFRRRAEFAPIFTKAFDEWRRETGRGLIAFLHELDPEMPVHRAGYMSHRTFTAAWYLLRVTKMPARSAPRKSATPMDMLIHLMKTTLPLFKDQDALWTVFENRSKWHERDLKRFRRAVGLAHPWPLTSAPRLVPHSKAS